MRRASSLLILMPLLTVPPPAFSSDSVVLGRGISNYFLSKQPCPQPEDSNLASICLDANFIWVLSARRTIVGPPVRGTVRAIFSQHVAATSKFVRSTELFVSDQLTTQHFGSHRTPIITWWTCRSKIRTDDTACGISPKR